MASGAVHTLLPKDDAEVEDVHDQLKQIIRDIQADEMTSEDFEKCLERRDDCVGLRHSEFLEIELIFDQICIQMREVLKGLIRVGAEDKFESINVMMLDFTEEGLIPVERIARVIDPRKVREKYTYKTVEAINPTMIGSDV